MAKYYSSTFGKISGKHGSAVAVIRKDGSTYLRLHVPASNPKTEKQQAHRAKFALTSKSLVPFNPIFKQTIGITNGISSARSYAFKNAIVGEYPNQSMDYEKLMFSFGALEKLHDPSFAINEGFMNVSWNFREMYNCHGDDSVSVIIFNKDLRQTIHMEDVALRSDRGIKIDIYDSWVDCQLCVWAYVRGGDKISDSVFVKKYNEENDGHSPDYEIPDQIINNVQFDNELIPHHHKINNNHIVSPIQSFVNKIVVSFMMLIYSVLGQLKQVFTTTISNSVTNALIYRPLSAVEYMRGSDIERVPKLNLRTTWRCRTIIDVLRANYNNMYSPVPISVMRC